jgi:single-stranded-DNA-specific exonuclease
LPLRKQHWQVAPRLSPETLAEFSDFSRHLEQTLGARQLCVDVARQESIGRLLLQLMHNRGVSVKEDMYRFLDRRAPDGTDPYQLKGMAAAVERLWAAIAGGEAIAVYGDYDADGITATAVMQQTLTALGANVRTYIPDRFEEGYGLNEDAISFLFDQGVQLIVTVDNGIRSVDDVVFGRELGLDFIITDHHTPGTEIPQALAVINPKQPDCPYPYKQLAGVGLAYKLSQALLQDGGAEMGLMADDLLDLVAIGTVADVTPLTGENRELVTRGLALLPTSPRPGLSALFDLISLDKENIEAWHIGFVIGPRLNAAGRMESAGPALELLLTQDAERAHELAQTLEEQNQLRRTQTEETVERIRQYVLADGVSSLLYLVAETDFNPGIVGLVAGRLTEEFHRPMLVAERGAAVTKGSARSIPGFHVTDALDECSDLLVRHGGHSAAAGFTVRNENLLALQTRLLQIAARELDEEKLTPQVDIDAHLTLSGVERDLVDSLSLLCPYGPGNSTPVFVSYGLEVREKRQIGADSRHLKLKLFDGKKAWDAVAFRQGNIYEDVPELVDVVYELDINKWNGREDLQLKVQDLRPTETAAADS